MSKDCWFKEEIKNNLPDYWKEPVEQNAAAMDESRVEYLFWSNDIEAAKGKGYGNTWDSQGKGVMSDYLRGWDESTNHEQDIRFMYGTTNGIRIYDS